MLRLDGSAMTQTLDLSTPLLTIPSSLFYSPCLPVKATTRYHPTPYSSATATRYPSAPPSRAACCSRPRSRRVLVAALIDAVVVQDLLDPRQQLASRFPVEGFEVLHLPYRHLLRPDVCDKACFRQQRPAMLPRSPMAEALGVGIAELGGAGALYRGGLPGQRQQRREGALDDAAALAFTEFDPACEVDWSKNRPASCPASPSPRFLSLFRQWRVPQRHALGKRDEQVAEMPRTPPGPARRRVGHP